jgi:hypothetical protein
MTLGFMVYAGVFQSKMYSYGGYFQSSDKNLKKNIQDVGDAMDIIKKLNPKNYEFKTDEKLVALNLPKGTHYGFIAQELEQVLPYIVNDGPQLPNNEPDIIKPTSLDGKVPVKATDPEILKAIASNKEIMSFKGVNYMELIPIMIKGMQELNERNEALQNEVNELKSIITKRGNAVSSTVLSGYIKQTIPNPANNNTVISYYLPDNITGKSQIMITDVKGSVLKVYNASKGAGQVNIRAGELAAGTYNYALYVNEKRIDSKEMVIIK